MTDSISGGLKIATKASEDNVGVWIRTGFAEIWKSGFWNHQLAGQWGRSRNDLGEVQYNRFPKTVGEVHTPIFV